MIKLAFDIFQTFKNRIDNENGFELASIFEFYLISHHIIFIYESISLDDIGRKNAVESDADLFERIFIRGDVFFFEFRVFSRASLSIERKSIYKCVGFLVDIGDIDSWS